VSKGILTMLAAVLFVGFTEGRAQEAVVAPTENLVIDGVPNIPASLAETAGRYGSYRFALVSDWHPARRQMLIRTRFADTPQVHLVKIPGGERQQLTFYPDSIADAQFRPNGGNYFVFVKDIGGGEWYQLNNIEKIKKPMLVVAGKNDPRVPVTDSEQIVGALKKQGTPVWYLMAKDEGHGFRKKQNQDFQFYTTVEFLEEYLLK
jgi:pimeloyl-ACP methyl ester carboxylesterase